MFNLWFHDAYGHIPRAYVAAPLKLEINKQVSYGNPVQHWAAAAIRYKLKEVGDIL